MAKQDSDVYADYLHDLGTLIREMAFDAKARAEASGRAPFDVGYMAGFHRVVSLMQQQAEAFGVPVERLALDGLDADDELV